MKFYPDALSPLTQLQSPQMLGLPLMTRLDYSTEGGRGIITDTVKTKASPANLPTWAKVRLVRDRDGKVIQETWTDPVTGAYTFSGFDHNQKYTVVAIHPTSGYRAVIADNLTPGLMS